MFFQFVLKGITGIDRAAAVEILTGDGIQCTWWRNVHQITPTEIRDKLTDRNLDWHLNHYDETDPLTRRVFSEGTPFISTTAGTVEPDIPNRRNLLRDAFYTAARFATDDFTRQGFVFHGYVLTLGREAIPLLEFAEEPRDLHVYTAYLPYRLEGEVVAKVLIPSVRLSHFEHFDGPALGQDLANRRPPTALETFHNRGYIPPTRYANIRGLLS